MKFILVIGLILIAGPLWAHDGHAPVAGELQHSLLHGQADLIPLLALGLLIAVLVAGAAYAALRRGRS